MHCMVCERQLDIMALFAGGGMYSQHQDFACRLRRGVLRLSLWVLFFVALLQPASAADDRAVYLQNMTIFQTHEWFGSPRVYFRCTDNATKVFLPDVTVKGQEYSFTYFESWQPLTTLPTLKCKRCGFYEADTIKSDDVFGEWELCPLDFSTSGLLTKTVEGEFLASFFCQDCRKPPPDNSTEGPGQLSIPPQLGKYESCPLGTNECFNAFGDSKACCLSTCGTLGSMGEIAYCPRDQVPVPAAVEGATQPGLVGPSQIPSQEASQVSSAPTKTRAKGLSGGAIAFIVVGSCLGALGMAAGLVFFQKYLRRKRLNNHARAFDLLFDSGDELEEEMESGRL